MAKTPTQNSRSKKILTGLLLATVSVCVTLALLEGAVRLLPTPYKPGTGRIFTCDNHVGWTGTPNFHDIFEDANFKQELVFNSLGMHDTEHPVEKNPNTFRILLLGDSFTHAIQVSEPETAHQILEDQLNQNQEANQPAIEVLSHGVVNWGTNQQLVHYREKSRAYRPNLVLLMFYIGNDLADNLPGNGLTIQGVNCYAPYFFICENNLNPTPLPYAPGISQLNNNCNPARRTIINLMGTLYQHSRLYQQIEPLIVANWPRQTFGQEYPIFYTALYLPDKEPKLVQAYQITQATIAQLRREVEADGSQFGVVLISPWPIMQLGLLSPAEREAYLKDNPHLSQAELDRPNRRLAEFLNNQNIPFIDLTQPMMEYSATHNHVPLYLLGEGHWNTEGNQVVGSLLSEWVTTTFAFNK